MTKTISLTLEFELDEHIAGMWEELQEEEIEPVAQLEKAYQEELQSEIEQTVFDGYRIVVQGDGDVSDQMQVVPADDTTTP